MDKNLERFLRYVKIDTQSDENSFTVPSAEKELNLTRLLEKELKEMGIPCYINEYGMLYGKLEGEPGLDPIGFNSHVDTALECSGKDVKPRIIHNYDGGKIILNEEHSMDAEKFPSLKRHIGDDLVVTSGDTLLGADDKAGIAIIMSMLDYYVSHPEIKHHPICILFSCDEEIGRGPKYFNAEEFGAKYAYTIDGGIYDEIAIETFNAAHAVVKIQGVAIHPGEAKGRMVNASTVAMQFDGLLPALARPEFTKNREGFNHLTNMVGETGFAELHYILRNHDRAKLEEQKRDFFLAAKKIESIHYGCKVNVQIVDDYRNMKEVFDEHPEAILKAEEVFKRLNLKPWYNPIRGGTDGATFSFKGCPTPNLGTGSYNHHGRYEYLSISEFNKMIEIVKEIVKA
ncbi:MAG: peptidase T [Bacilli bacterium]|nr:peptidase T [Bacilli bacterium]